MHTNIITRYKKGLIFFCQIYLKNIFISQKNYKIYMKVTNSNKVSDPCIQKLDRILIANKVERQSYHGKCFVGIHVHKMLKVGGFFYFLFIIFGNQ